MVSNGCTPCIAFLVSVTVVLSNAASLPTNVNDIYNGISPDEVETIMALITKSSPDDISPPFVDDEVMGEPAWRLRRLNEPVLSGDEWQNAQKRAYRVNRRGNRHTFNELIRRLLALQGKRVPEGRTNTLRFGSGRK